MFGIRTSGLVAALSSCLFVACGDDGGSTNENEVITTVILEFAPAGGGAAIAAEFDDPDGDGGAPPTIDPVNLTAGTYALAVRFQNRLETPAEEITTEVTNESAFHQLFFTGTAVVGPASSTATGPLTQSYSDQDANGFPIGLANAVTAAAGTGTLTVTLRHMPPEEPPVKAANTAMLVKSGGLDAIGGSTDAQVNFTVNVQ